MKNSSDISIFVYYYKNNIFPVRQSIYRPVMAGNVLQERPNNFTGDDTGDSISEKNKYYSELTGIYWAWKNTSYSIIGSCHYRRFFIKEEPLLYKTARIFYFFAGMYRNRYGLIYSKRINYFSGNILSESDILRIMNNYDAIFPIRRILKNSVKEHYCRHHHAEDLDLMKKIIQKKYPDYLPAFDQTLNSNRLYANNMYILKKEDHNRLMTWLFCLLFEFEIRIDKSEYKGYQQRVFGFLSERLLTTWVLHNKLRIKELPVIYFKSLKYI